MNYCIVTASTPDALVDLVTYNIQQGWVPQGGVAYHPSSNGYAQAMIYPA